MIHGLLYITMGLLLAQTSPDEAVMRGRETLDHRWGGYPWYDSESDAIQPIEISEPTSETRSRNRSSSGLAPALANILSWVLWLAVAAVLLAVVSLLVFAYFRDGNLRWARPAKRNKDDTDHRRRIEALPFPVQATKLDFLAEARRFYQQAQYGEAVKYLFSYQLVQLDKHRLVRLTRGKTNRQYLREVARRGQASLGGLLEQTMLAFEDFFFGNHPIDRTRFEACWTRLPEFEARLKGTTG